MFLNGTKSVSAIIDLFNVKPMRLLHWNEVDTDYIRAELFSGEVISIPVNELKSKVEGFTGDVFIEYTFPDGYSATNGTISVHKKDSEAMALISLYLSCKKVKDAVKRYYN